MANNGDSNNTIHKLLVEEMEDLYSAENQLVKALPEMANAAHDPKLKEAFEEHLEQTKGHVERLEEAFNVLGTKVKAKACKGMQGLVKEGTERIDEGKDKNESAADLALIAAAQKVEHYEISGYKTVENMAKQIGNGDAAKLFQQTLSEEENADKTLNEIAKPLLGQVG